MHEKQTDDDSLLSQNITYVQQAATGACISSIAFCLLNTQLGDIAIKEVNE
jgi:hypothetical protein